MSTLNTAEKLNANAKKYRVDDLPSASFYGTRLSKILFNLHNDISLSKIELIYLNKSELLALNYLALNEIHFDVFVRLASIEQETRINKAKETAIKLLEEKQNQEFIYNEHMNQKMAILHKQQKAQESDPKYIFKMENQALREKYNIDFYVDQHDFSLLMQILKKADKNHRLDELDISWLSTKGKPYFTETLRHKYHSLEADYFQKEYANTNDIWMAINASSHYRKAKKANLAKVLLINIGINNQKSKKIKSALNTTLGGAYRDLKETNSALECGETAHTLTPDDFRPCTLLGAINIELGNLELGFSWYEKAKERGAKDQSIDEDIKTIFMRANQDQKQNLIRYLAKYDSTLCQKLEALLKKKKS